MSFISKLTNNITQVASPGHHKKFQSLDAADVLLVNDAASLRQMYIEWGGVPAVDAEVYLATLGNREALNAAINWYRAARDSAINIAELSSITVPTLHTWGTNDSTVGRIAAEGTRDMVDGPFKFVQLLGLVSLSRMKYLACSATCCCST